MRIEVNNTFLAAALFATALAQSSVAQIESTSVLRNVVDSYLDLKNALTRDDGDSAKIVGGQLQSAILNVTMDSLPYTQRAVWTQFDGQLSHDAEQITASDDIDGLRDHFQSLSVNMYRLLKALNINTVDMYYQYCPMAKAYWVSGDAKIINPYQGKMMLTCGSNKDTLRAAK
jgi:hypothetical protein